VLRFNEHNEHSICGLIRRASGERHSGVTRSVTLRYGWLWCWREIDPGMTITCMITRGSRNRAPHCARPADQATTSAGMQVLAASREE